MHAEFYLENMMGRSSVGRVNVLLGLFVFERVNQWALVKAWASGSLQARN